MLKVKICGITRVQDALAAAEEGADYVGLIFARSPRKIDPAAAHDIARKLPRGVEAVGVFMDQPLGEVRGLLRETGIRIAQLHGAEDPAYGRSLGVPYIKAFDTFTDRTLKLLKTHEALAFLLDLPKGAAKAGDVDPAWAKLAKKHGKVLLAGRLTPDRVGPLVRKIRPWGVDVSSGVETSPGIKDRALIRAFIQAARSEPVRKTEP